MKTINMLGGTYPLFSLRIHYIWGSLANRLMPPKKGSPPSRGGHLASQTSKRSDSYDKFEQR